MKINQLLVSWAALCAIATVVGCASTDRPASQSSFDVMSLNRDGGQFSAESSSGAGRERAYYGGRAPPIFKTGFQPVIQPSLQKPNLETNGAVSLDEWQRSDSNAGPKENFSALDVNGGAQLNATEILAPAPKHAKRYHFFADPEKTNQDYSSRGQEEFQPQGLQLFSIRF